MVVYRAFPTYYDKAAGDSAELSKNPFDNEDATTSSKTGTTARGASFL
jgi:hypothetical protein